MLTKDVYKATIFKIENKEAFLEEIKRVNEIENEGDKDRALAKVLDKGNFDCDSLINKVERLAAIAETQEIK